MPSKRYDYRTGESRLTQRGRVFVVYVDADRIIYNWRWEPADASNGDLHLQSGDTILKDAGQDLSSDPDSYGGSISTTLAADIDNVARSGTWDIGADEAR